MTIPSKQECFYILEMLESSLIDFSYTEPWAEELIAGTDTPPAWLCELTIKEYQGDQKKVVREHVFNEPFEAGPPELEKFHVACLWLRYERRELSWATFLRCAGEYLDAVSGDWDCETPYHYLNIYEDAYFSETAEEDTKRRYLVDHNLKPWIEMARQKFAIFEKLRRANRSVTS